MKLEELALEVAFEGSRIDVGRFSDGLTFLYGENAAGKTLSARLLRQLLLDDPSGTLVGSVIVNRAGDRFRVQRERVGEPVSVTPMTVGYTEMKIPHREPLMGDLEASLYDAIFNVSFRKSHELSQRLAAVLVDTLQVTRTSLPGGGVDRAAELAAAHDRQAMIQAQLATLEYEKQQRSEAGRSTRHRQEQSVAACRAELRAVNDQLASLHESEARLALNEIDAELQRLQGRIDQELSQASLAPPVINPDRYALLYQRLDLIEDQIRRWRQLQSDVQQQRIRLRDQMQLWNELTLDNESHPYHVARELLIQLEDKVDLTERNARHWASAGGAHVDHDQIARTLGQLCQSMRDDLEGLCGELSQQYKQLRHRAAALELKHLRHAYTEMGQALERLQQQRAASVNELRLVDPAGAEAIIKADPEFCRMARVHGLLEARKKWVGESPVAELPLTATPDWAETRARIDQLKRRRQHLLEQVEVEREQAQRLQQQQATLQLQLEDWDRQLAQQSVSRLPEIESQIAALRSQREALLEQIDRLQNQVTRHPILQRADGLLEQITRGELIRVGVGPTFDDGWTLEVRNRAGKVLAIESLEPAQQDQVCLSLMLATKEYLKVQRGLEAPTCIDDAFCRIQGDAISPTLKVLADFCRQGHQVILLTQHRYLADRVPGATVLDLSASTTPAEPLVTPPRVVPLRKSDWASENRFDDVAFRAPTPASPVPVESFGQKLEFVPSVHRQTRLDQVPLFDVGHLQRFSDVGLETVEELLALDLDGVELLGISADRVDRWQAQLWLLMHVPGLRPQDARLLVACGIVEPQQLVTSHAQQLYERMHQYLATTAGQRSGLTQVGISLQRIESWLKVLQENPGLWRQRSRTPLLEPEESVSHTKRRALAPQQVTEGRDTRGRMPQVVRAPRMHVPRPVVPTERHEEASGGGGGLRTEKPKTRRRSGVPQSATQQLKYYLDLQDHIEAAPSIGPKTAERFENIGVATVEDFLQQTAESMATKLNYKRISAGLIRRWQQQARLVCRIPNLRGHDAQLLVACDIVDPEDLAALSPQQLLDKVGPFSQTKEGLKILRSAKEPDLEEVANWIAWAGQHRSLQAA